MAKEFSRADRVAQQMKREIAVLLQREFKDPRVKMATVSDVRVSGDLSYAKVYVTFLNLNSDESEVNQAIKVLNRAKGFFRGQIGRLMKLRIVPEIAFYHDKSLDTGMRLSSLITSTIAHDRALSRKFGTEEESTPADAQVNTENLEEEE
ncbi:30S ribosome-binding factor RbfA [uncultured Ruminobacter sp.]|uniref:30S ribosome-binding factor RbfA n=1 Tax=uncultured Ruminobacter sp. TaxID=538947 RepID=UPI0025FA170E|nr:30S ribosome-binding factor RbfA [uncultured Ruminobacter sp.]